MKKHFGSIFFLLSLLPQLANAQVQKLTDQSSFSSQAVDLTFRDQVEGANAQNLLSKWGIMFRDNPLIFGGRLVSGKGALSERPLVIDLEFPAQRVGFLFTLEKGELTAKPIITAFNPEGKELGTVEHERFLAPEETIFLGITTQDWRGISKLRVVYHNPTVFGAPVSRPPVTIENLKLDFTVPPKFAEFIAQVGDGPLPDGSGNLQTIIAVSNPNNLQADGEIEFFNNSGAPLPLTVDGKTGERFAFAIKPFSSRLFISGGISGPVKVGYAKISSNLPVQGAAVFRVLEVSGNIVSEAGIASDRGKVAATGTIQRASIRSFDTGIALVNTRTGIPQLNSAKILLQLVDEAGALIGPSKTLELTPGAHLARFIGELFPNVARDFNGSLQIRSSAELAIVMLRTRNGLPVSSLPVASTARD